MSKLRSGFWDLTLLRLILLKSMALGLSLCTRHHLCSGAICSSSMPRNWIGQLRTRLEAQVGGGDLDGGG
eukprot:7212017-Pyramimonas_sp.AAC.1